MRIRAPLPSRDAHRDGHLRVRAVRQDGRPGRRGRRAGAGAGRPGPRGGRLPAAATAASSARRSSRRSQLTVPMGIDPRWRVRGRLRARARDAPDGRRRMAIGCGWWSTRPASTATGSTATRRRLSRQRRPLHAPGRAALEAMRAEARPVDVLHGHDWQAGAGHPVAAHAVRPRPAASRAMRDRAHLPQPRVPRLGAPGAGVVAGPARGIGAMPEGVDLLREAIRAADLVNTVSPTYARESLTAEYGAGLDDVLRERGDRYIGIMNGIDPDVWDPATDARAGRDATPPTTRSGKLACRRRPVRAAGPRPGGAGDGRRRAGSTPRRASTWSPTPRHALLEPGARLVGAGHRRPHAWSLGCARRRRSGPTASRSSSASTATRRGASMRARTCS